MSNHLATGNFRKGNVTLEFSMRRSNVPGQFCVDYTLCAKGGATLHKGMFCVDMIAIQEAVKGAINRQGPVGWSWKRLKKKVSKVANKAAVTKIARQLDSIASDPRFQQVAAVAQTVYPPLGVPMSVAVKASQMYHAAKAGDPAARQQIANIVNQAAQGNVKAQHVAKAFAVFNQAEKAGHSVSGWAENLKKGWWLNVPYRGNVAAGHMDRTSPAHISRKLISLAQDATARGHK